MKKYILCLVIPLVALFYSCETTTNGEKVKKDLIAVNEEERDAYFARDLSRLEAVWKQDSTSKRIFSGQNSVLELKGWKEIRADYENEIGNDELWADVQVTAGFENYDVMIYGSTANLFHDIHWTGTYKGEVVDMWSKRIAHFVRDGGVWKLDMTVQIRVPDENPAKNKNTSAIYHQLKEENIDEILTEDFIGRSEQNMHTWDRESHHGYLGNGVFKRDSIYQQVAEGNWVATRFFREMDYQGRRVKVDAMHFKRFEDGKIAEIWEYGDSEQFDQE